MTAAWPVLDRWTGAVTDPIVVLGRLVADVSFRVAQARLGLLARDGMLLRASEAAYGQATTAQPGLLHLLPGLRSCRVVVVAAIWLARVSRRAG